LVYIGQNLFVKPSVLVATQSLDVPFQNEQFFLFLVHEEGKAQKKRKLLNYTHNPRDGSPRDAREDTLKIYRRSRYCYKIKRFLHKTMLS
jgi:hypothetical protein